MNNERDDAQPKQLIYETVFEVQEWRNKYYEEGAEGTVSVTTHKKLASLVVAYWDVLYEYRNETILEEDDFPDISEVRKRIGERTTVHKEAPGDTNNVTPVEQPAVMELPGDYLMDLLRQLHDIRNKIGFKSNIQTKRPIYHAGKLDPEDYDEPVKDTIPKPK